MAKEQPFATALYTDGYGAKPVALVRKGQGCRWLDAKGYVVDGLLQHVSYTERAMLRHAATHACFSAIEPVA